MYAEDLFMRKSILLAATIACLSLTICSCKDSKPSGEHTHDEQPITQEEVETNKQTKLNAISPTVYSRIANLNLEPGSRISIIGRYVDNSFWKQVAEGAQEAVDDLNAMLGYTGNDKIILTYSGPSESDNVDEQINILDEELSRYPIAIGIAAIDTAACTLQFDLASENDIPIITFDSGSEYNHVASHIATDNFAAAGTAASKLAYAIEEQGEVAVFVQDSISMTATDRLQGFLDQVAREFPDVTIVNTYYMDQQESIAEKIAIEQDIEDSSSITQEDIVRYILEKNPNIKGIFATNLDATQLVANTVKNLERTDIKIVGFDGGKEQLKFLEDGTVEGLILQNPFGMGYATVIAAARVHLDLGNESVVDTGYVWVTKDNMEQTSISNMLY